MTLRRALSTGEVADLMNAVLRSEVYSPGLIRAEIDAGRIRAVHVGAGRRYRRRVRVTEEDFLQWAAAVLRADEVQALRASLAQAS
ncbi:MAG: hypothetical protein AB7I13_00735 [Vicinamibacterales bacterium]